MFFINATRGDDFVAASVDTAGEAFLLASEFISEGYPSARVRDERGREVTIVA